MTENKPIETCEFFNICETDCDGTLEDTEMCSYYELYKQLKRKEQECDELTKNYIMVIQQRNVAEQQLDQLKAENEDLKKCYKNNSVLLDFEETNTTKLVNKVMKLEQTLTEIKEIASKVLLNTHDLE